MKKVLLGIVVFLVIALVGGYWYMLPTFKVATGYTAKAVCSYHFLTGQDLESIKAELPGSDHRNTADLERTGDVNIFD